MAVYNEGFAPSGDASRTNTIMNFAGAGLSLALILGVSFWGYKLIMRDVTGIPVVRAMEGEMRVLPDNPGGAVATHTGLSVNEVAAIGEAGGPEDRLVLAPTTAGLAQEDLDAQPVAEVDAFAMTTDLTQAEADAVVGEILAIASQTAEDANPEVAQIVTIAADVPGVARSLRPVIRPASLRAAPVAATNNEIAVNSASFAVGTNLVQLGAFPSPELAATQWALIEGRFDTLLAGKERVIQVSDQSSGTWYRLRASGFEDRAEARRFCAALEAEGADCIAVVVN
ncbi:SPOR domain-containing protein [Loktanella sp. D2R18]|uniref:SPOR domain-containing protein n=1 Tax=Rhodobacterales TaxID=204455 RepID=UPI000DE87E04|nr:MULTISPECIES: SPOR domain-containing protein [Rhodobacterales]MDO6589655.1 SPOR domain-containing protein [Yoonia sp. 1_MG-2023]RBW44287.1 SPOR domain-containing protein [Loktanella sp. D2R18]